MRRVVLILTAAVVATAATAHAQLSLQSTVDLALKNDARVKAAQADLDKARAALSELHSAYIPVVSTEGGYGKSVGPPLGVPVAFSLSSHSLVYTGAQRDNMRAANLAVQAAEKALTEAESVTEEETTTAYLQQSLAEQRTTLLDEEQTLASGLVKIVQDRLSAGVDSQLDLLKARHTVAELKLARLTVEDQLTAAADQLGTLTGLTTTKWATVASSIPPLSVQDGTLKLPDTDPGIEALEFTARSKQAVAAGARRYKFWPQAVLVANYQYVDTQSSSSDFVKYYPAYSRQPGNGYSVAISMNFTLFDRVHDAQAREAQADAVRAFHDARIKQVEFINGRKRLSRQAELLSARAELAQSDAELAQAALAAVQVQLTGATNASTPLTPKDEIGARLDVDTKKMAALDAKEQLWRADISLLRMTGQLHSWLQSGVTTR